MQALHYRIISELAIECTDYLKNGFFRSFYDFVTSQDIEATNFLINLGALNIIFIKSLSSLPPSLPLSLSVPLSIQLFNFTFWNYAIFQLSHLTLFQVTSVLSGNEKKSQS